MRKVVLLLLLSFMLMGIFINSSFVLADENNDSNSNNDSGRDDSVSDNSDSEDEDDSSSDDENLTDDSRLEVEDEDTNKEISDRNKITSRVRERIIENGCVIKVEKEVKFENGKRTEVIKRKIKCEDGREAEVKVKIENRTSEGKFRERIEYEFEGKGFEVEAEDGIDLEENTNGSNYTMRARMRNGNHTNIKIMPDQASEIALARLRARNFTVELREVNDSRNIPHVIYNIEANKTGRFLGVFKMKLKAETQIDPETGDVVSFHKPWWAFLVSGEDSDQTQDTEEDSNDGAITNQVPAPGEEGNGVEEMIVENNSGASGTFEAGSDDALNSTENDTAA